MIRSRPTPGSAPIGSDAPATRLAARDLALGYEGRTVVDGLDLDLPDRKVTVVIGANACGKSTLLRGLARLLAPTHGAVLLDGRDIRTLATRAVARDLALLPQEPIAPAGITVAELVARGRHPRHGAFGRPDETDDQAVAHALTLTRTLDLAGRVVDDLSGGQRQRVWIAMALAQETDLLLLDEPTTYLDVAHQLEVLDVIVRLNRERGTTVAMVLHDLMSAARCADHLVAMRRGRIVAQGPPADVLTADLVGELYGIEARILPDPLGGGPLVVPLARRPVPEEES